MAIELFNINKEVNMNTKDLYVKCEKEVLDFITYFNSFSLKKWKKYTYLKKIEINVEINGKFNIEIIGLNLKAEKVIFSDNIVTGVFKWSMEIKDLDYDIIGFKLIKLSPESSFISGKYYGEFFKFNEKLKIAIAMCTYKREKYVYKNMRLIEKLLEKNKNISLTIVDNGNTLEEIKEERKMIVHNPNYGGAGGFTRGLLENVEKSDYTILMDDDIEVGEGVLERTYTFLASLKNEYSEFFLSGSMLIKDKPLIQEECTAYWKGLRLSSNGKGFNLTEKANLLKNENIVYKKNSYGAWWFCAIPNKIVKEIGYPLPIFIKCDDVEYSLRNSGRVLSMNGIGVWHEAFNKKKNIPYYGIRNSMILNSLQSYSRTFFIFHTLLRFGKMLLINSDKLKELIMAMDDFSIGIYGLLEKTPLEKHDEVRMLNDEKLSFDSTKKFVSSFLNAISKYNHVREENKKFLLNNLRSGKFWCKILKINERDNGKCEEYIEI